MAALEIVSYAGMMIVLLVSVIIVLNSGNGARGREQQVVFSPFHPYEELFVLAPRFFPHAGDYDIVELETLCLMYGH